MDAAVCRSTTAGSSSKSAAKRDRGPPGPASVRPSRGLVTGLLIGSPFGAMIGAVVVGVGRHRLPLVPGGWPAALVWVFADGEPVEVPVVLYR